MKIIKIKLKDLERVINEQIVTPIQIGKYVYDKYKELTSPKDNKQKKKEINLLPFSEKNLGQELKNQGVMYPDVAMAQSMLETGYFKSGIFLDNNNLFGMKHPRQRQTLSKGPNRGHASFDNWQDSVKDYKMWQDYNKLSNLSKDQYVAKLNRIYCIPPSCGSNNYAKKVKSLLSRASSSIG
jgi:uncharacterized FlgJ-related protein